MFSDNVLDDALIVNARHSYSFKHLLVVFRKINENNQGVDMLIFSKCSLIPKKSSAQFCAIFSDMIMLFRAIRTWRLFVLNGGAFIF